ncbi:MAG: hypothetical protein K8F36_09905, partial [Melioribacteraceae bacterium]|nr:hypothetical protein [Melioribacteraceae bacterium]
DAIIIKNLTGKKNKPQSGDIFQTYVIISPLRGSYIDDFSFLQSFHAFGVNAMLVLSSHYPVSKITQSRRDDIIIKILKPAKTKPRNGDIIRRSINQSSISFTSPTKSLNKNYNLASEYFAP